MICPEKEEYAAGNPSYAIHCGQSCVEGFCLMRHERDHGCPPMRITGGVHEAMPKDPLDLRSKSPYVCRHCLQVMEVPA